MFQHHLSFFFRFHFCFFHGWSKVYSISHKVLADALIAAQRHTGPTCGTWILVVLKHLELGACLHSTRGQSLLKEITYCIHRTVDAGMFIPNIFDRVWCISLGGWPWDMEPSTVWPFFLVSRVCLEMNGFKLRVVRVFKLRSVDRLGSRVPRCCKMDVVLFFVTIVMVSGY